MNRLAEKIKKAFKDKRVAVIGDVVADQFLNGTISRVSREAPVFIIKHEETETLPGGAANAAANVAALGGAPVLIGVIGNDENGRALLNALVQKNVDDSQVLTAPGFSTTTKVRVIGGQPYSTKKQVIRIDYENRREIEKEMCGQLLAGLKNAAANAGAIVLSDYNYGVAFPELIETAKHICQKRSIPLVVDSRFRLEQFTGATTATPNQEEVEQLLGKPFETADCDALRRRLKFASLLITLGGRGMVLAENGKPPLAIPAVGSDQPLDVTGAGDTVIAAYALGLAAGLNYAEAASVANHAGSIVVMKRGTAVAAIDELVESLTEPVEDASAAANEG